MADEKKIKLRKPKPSTKATADAEQQRPPKDKKPSGRLPTSDIVNKVFEFCEALSGLKFYPYQVDFAKRIIRSVVNGEGEEITALFSRQCLRVGSPVITKDGEIRKIEDIEGAWLSDIKARCFKVCVKGGHSISATAEHPVYTDKGWRELKDLQLGDKVAVLTKWDKFAEQRDNYIEDKVLGKIAVGEELAELCGNVASIPHNKTKEFIMFVMTKLKCMFPDMKCSIRRCLYGDAYDLVCSSGRKKDERLSLIYRATHSYEFVNLFDKARTVAYLRGLLFGMMGTIKGDTDFVDFHRLLFLKLGISTITMYDYAKHVHYLAIAGVRSAEVYSSLFPGLPYVEVGNIEEPNPRRMFMPTGEEFIFSPVVGIYDDGEHATWDMEVSEKEWFVGGGIKTHNSGKSHTVAAVMGGMVIILPIMANMPMFMYDSRFQMFKEGFLLGIFAPSLRQSKIVFNKLRNFLKKPQAAEVLSDPDINVTFGTNNGENIVLNLNNLGVSSTIKCISASEGSNIEGESLMVIVCDEAQDIDDYKYKKSIGPMGSAYNATSVLIGTPTTYSGFFYEAIQRNKREYANGERKKCHYEADYKVVMIYNPHYAAYIEGQKRKIGLESDEFKMSYALIWLLERGMFIDVDKLEALGVSEREVVEYGQFGKKYVAGVDLGKTKDKTVVTIGEVDWENPIVIEKSKVAGVPDLIVYDVTVVAWMERHGDNWTEQKQDIVDFLEMFDLHKVVIDGTGVGSSVYDELELLLKNADIDCEPFVFSLQSKSALFKHFDSQIKAGRFHYVAGCDTKETTEYENFIKEMSIAQKNYNGAHMIVQAPNDRKSHDDYVVSSALMVWAARSDSAQGVSRPETSNANVFKDKYAQYFGKTKHTIKVGGATEAMAEIVASRFFAQTPSTRATRGMFSGSNVLAGRLKRGRGY